MKLVIRYEHNWAQTDLSLNRFQLIGGETNTSVNRA